MATKLSTLTRVSKKTLEDIKKLQEDYGFKNSREVIDLAVGQMKALLANQAFDALAKKSGVIHAKRRRR